jgi:DNA-binding response OmpR family regulator
MEASILIIDDDEELCQLLEEFLVLEGFTVSCRHDGNAGLQRCLDHDYDALVLDIMLPGLPGLEVLKRLRRHTDLPVLMLTARGEATDRILGLELGADDYLPKPFNPLELAARLRAILRRGVTPNGREAPSAVEVAGVRLNPADRSATVAGQDLGLTSTEFNLLLALVSAAGQVVDKNVLSNQALGRDITPYDRSVDVHVSHIRKKLAALGASDLIVSVRGIGYQFVIPEARA